ncbi:TetR/AcrR family transcriptional regulator [Actinoallomurus rhizosphaericola]|uniref:TetR/AcrR family transcriptional regulator n=1 Tax=Actinoallomurus rhizosphaericola TaxID=2952536 RepID=UPI0020918222|nr:TetR/AcrR family transcriptional regulator [Actinoallomurus rhizosphaericola]MCO5991870.1 TetR/AcrR family transcriptional regulator [Actinoallomurus rhizosphaericola]
MTDATTERAPLGRRERKKAATRQALADAALRLFLERGYDQVGIRDIAEAADVSTTTLFKHFPGKEALVFDEDAELEAALIAAVRERPEGTSIPAALRDYVRRSRRVKGGDAGVSFTRFVELVENTPELREYERRMWMRHETALARAIAEEIGAPADDPTCRALAHFALETRYLPGGSADADTAIACAFELLEHGWSAVAQNARD